MCIICVEYEQGRLTICEAIRNYGELKDTLSKEHQREMENSLFNKFPYYPDLSDYLNEGDEYWEISGFGD